MAKGEPVRVEFFLVPGFSLLALSCAVDALRAANLVLGWTAYRWRLSADPEAAESAGSPRPAISACRRRRRGMRTRPALLPS